MGTTDERKCDAFALLKIMQEYPQHAKTIFDIYNIQRSKMGYTVVELHGKDDASKQRAIKSGAMTYLMPNTYKKLEQYALNPQLIPENDLEILKLSCQLTAEPDFSKAQLSAYADLMKKDNITPQDLANNEIVQSCMRQGGFDNINKYIASDKKLQGVIKQDISFQKITDIPEKQSPLMENIAKFYKQNRVKLTAKKNYLLKNLFSCGFKFNFRKIFFSFV